MGSFKISGILYSNGEVIGMSTVRIATEDLEDIVKKGISMDRTHLHKDEIVWERIFNEKGVLTYVVTSDRRRDNYRLYSVTDDEFRLIGKDKNPIDLKRKFKY